MFVDNKLIMKKNYILTLLVGIFMYSGSVNAQTYTFTNAGASGRMGPNQLEVDAAYTGTPLDGDVTVTTQGIQEWVVPLTGAYMITTSGAQGGTATGPSTAGGLGAEMVGEFNLIAGETILIVVGQEGGSISYGGGGGGGSFVVGPGNVPLIIAGGGGGGNGNNPSFPARGAFMGEPGLTTTAAGSSNITAGASGNPAPGIGGGSASTGGTDGYGGGGGYSGSGGGGFYHDGGIGDIGEAGFGFLNGAIGGQGWLNATISEVNAGGFGCGGGGGDVTGYGGGGGGYSGGGGGNWDGTTHGCGGGGGSFNSGANMNNTAGANTGNGSVIITLTCDVLTTTVSATTVCLGETVVLQAESTNGGTITWDNGITDNVAFTPAVGGTTYTATSSEGNDCSFSQLITVNVLPTVYAGVDINICNTGIDTLLSGSGALTYVWNNGITDSVSFTPGIGITTYTVTGIDANNCENTDDLIITIGGPIINATITHENVGNDGAIDINVTGGSGSNSYSWSNGPMTEDITGLTAGTYTVTVDDGDCSNDTTFTVLSVASVESLDQKGLAIYPNPTKGMINIQLEGEFTYAIHNSLGQKIVTGTANGGDKIDLTSFENGVYFVQISDGIIRETIKLVKH